MAIRNAWKFDLHISNNTTIDSTVTNYDGENLFIANAAVTVTGAIHSFNSITVSGSGSLVLNGGTVRGASIVTTNGGSLVVNGSGTLDGVTINGLLDVGNTYNGASLTVTNGLVLNGTRLRWATRATTTMGVINFAGTQTLSGNGTVGIGNNDYCCPRYYNSLWLSSVGTTLTIGSGITIEGQNGVVGYNPWVGRATECERGQSRRHLGGCQRWHDRGQCPAVHQPGCGAESAGTLQLAGTLNTAGLGSLQSSNGLIEGDRVSGEQRDMLTLNGTNNVLTFQGGMIHDGTVVTTNGAALIVNGSGTLDGVTV